MAPDLAYLRKRAATYRTATAVIADYTPVHDALGGETEVWVDRPLSVWSRLGPPTAREARVFAARYNTRATDVVSLPNETVLAARVRFYIEGQWWEAVAIPPHGTLSVERRIPVVKV